MIIYIDIKNVLILNKKLTYTEEQLMHILVQRHLITHDQIEVALSDRMETQHPIEQIIVDLGYICPIILQKLKSEISGLPCVDLSRYQITDIFSTFPLPLHLCLEYKACPFQQDGETLWVAMSDPENIKSVDQIRHYIYQTQPHISTLHFYHADDRQIMMQLQTVSPEQRFTASDSPLVLLEHIIEEAVRKSVSDIHFQPDQRDITVRFRIDGLLKTACVLHPSKWSQILNRLKVCANLDIAETRRPQSGHFLKTIYAHDIDIRVSTHPTLYGENAVLRLLDKAKRILSLDELGFPAMLATNVRCMTKAPQGLIILTGPTGAGKTTTLYALLSAMNPESRNMMTLEAPIESVLPGIRQTEIRDHRQLTYADGVRSLLRQDPDVILIGEMRDEETARMALRAVLTGHLVLSTLHTQDVLGVPGRLLDLGLSPVLLAGALQGVIAQRLVRCLCQTCYGEGCTQCTEGFKGRTVIAEHLVFDDEFNDIITNGGDRSALSALRKKRMFPTLWDHGVELVEKRITTREELIRVLGMPSPTIESNDSALSIP
jgi:type II secretory ATPase GspE/PulE/Tfp pilus assembly ATPase PilB-like protein